MKLHDQIMQRFREPLDRLAGHFEPSPRNKEAVWLAEIIEDAVVDLRAVEADLAAVVRLVEVTCTR